MLAYDIIDVFLPWMFDARPVGPHRYVGAIVATPPVHLLVVTFVVLINVHVDLLDLVQIIGVYVSQKRPVFHILRQKTE